MAGVKLILSDAIREVKSGDHGLHLECHPKNCSKQLLEAAAVGDKPRLFPCEQSVRSF